MKVWQVDLYGLWGMSIPEKVFCDDGFDRDLCCSFTIFDKVCDGAEMHPSLATNSIPAEVLRKIHHTGGQRQICSQHTLVLAVCAELQGQSAVLCRGKRPIWTWDRNRALNHQLIQSSILRYRAHFWF